MLYGVHDGEGRILQANKVYSPGGLVNSSGKPASYDDLLSERELSFIRDPIAEHLGSHEHFRVDTKNKVFVSRDIMPVRAISTKIKVNEKAVILGIPKGAKVEIFGAGALLYCLNPFPGTELDFQIVAPMVQTVRIELWPFRTSFIDIEATA